MLSYRHAFHAGNHADVLKHSTLVALLRYFNQKEKPYWYIDTHAGAGCYSLGSTMAEKNAEFQEGVGRLWGREDLPEALRDYMAAVAQFSPAGKLLFYPGSPAIAMTQLRATDKMRLFELHPTDADLLGQTFRDASDQVQIQKADGLNGLRAVLPPPPRRAVVLIDPSYEIKEDYRAIPRALEAAQRRFETGTYAVWYPCLSRREAQDLPERLRDVAAGDWLDARLIVRAPSKGDFGMTGSGMFILNPPWTLPRVLEAVLPYLCDRLAVDRGAQYTLDYQIR